MKGMQKIRRGRGFRGVSNYTLSKGQLIGGNMLGQNARELAAEFALGRQMRPDIEKPVWHNSLRLPKDDTISNDKWVEIADEYMQNLGFTEQNQRFYSLENDGDGQHIHIVASRIGLDGSIYYGRNENLHSTRIIQDLEKKHGLTITKGAEYTNENGNIVKVTNDKRTLSKNEIDMAYRTGEEPPKQKLQRIIDEAKQDKPSAPEFMERLMVAGVGVKANVAKTGRMNGFSFEVDGISFKASQLGKSYAWKELSKEVLYEQDRDSEKLRQLNTSTGGAPTASGAEHSDTGIGSEFERAAGFGSGADQPGFESERPSAESVRADERNLSDSAAEYRRGVESYQDGSEQAVYEQKSQFATNDQASSKRSEKDQRVTVTDTDASSKLEHGSGESDNKSNDIKNASGGVKHNSGEIKKGELQNNDLVRSHSISRDSAVDRNNVDWNKLLEQKSSRESGNTSIGNGFKGVASTIQRESKQNKTVDRELVAGTKSIDPTLYFESKGFEVRKDGNNHLSIRMDGVEHFRSSFKEGKWLHCHNTGEGIGDNIALVRELDGCGFAEAVYSLYGSPEPSLQRPRPVSYQPRPEQRPRLPRQTIEAKQEGRAYLQSRGISQDTIKHAESNGFLYHIGGGPCFIGKDENNDARNVTKRLIEAEYDKRKEKYVTKRDLEKTDKTYPPILPGRKDEIWIVEGGADALALHDMYKRRKQEPPTAIVSGGADVMKFFNNDNVQELLKNTNKVVVSYDNEKDPQTQAEKDAAHDKQIAKVKEFNESVEKFKPEQQYKDIADINQSEHRRDLYNKQLHEQARAERAERAQSRGYEPDM